MDLKLDSEDDGLDDWPKREDIALVRVSQLVVRVHRVERETRGLVITADGCELVFARPYAADR